MYYNDYETEPIGGDNPYYRCVHCHRSVPEINGRIEGHLDYCFYRRCREANYDYGLAWAREKEGKEIWWPTDVDGPEFHDGSYEDGFRGPRPWNGYDDSEEKARKTKEGESRGSGIKLFDVSTPDDSLRLFDVDSTDDSLKLFGDD